MKVIRSRLMGTFARPGNAKSRMNFPLRGSGPFREQGLDLPVGPPQRTLVIVEARADVDGLVCASNTTPSGSKNQSHRHWPCNRLVGRRFAMCKPG